MIFLFGIDTKWFKNSGIIILSMVKKKIYIDVQVINTMNKYSLNLFIWLTGGPGWFFVTIQHKYYENETTKTLHKYTGHALQKLLKGLLIFVHDCLVLRGIFKN